VKHKQNTINDDEIWSIVDFWLKKDYIRWINFQPVAFFWKGNYNTKKWIK